MTAAAATTLLAASAILAVLKWLGRFRPGWLVVGLPGLIGLALIGAAFGAFLTMLATVAATVSGVL